MPRVTFFDNIQSLINVISSSTFFIILLVVMILLAGIFITTTKKNQKETKQAYLLIVIMCLLVLLIKYGNSIGKLWDYFMNNVFIVIYFPNLAIYVLALIISNIIMWKTIFKDNVSKQLKIINGSIYFIIHYFLILIIGVITEEKLDIFSQTSVYQNSSALAIIELSSTIFILWILFLIGYYLIMKYLKKPIKSKDIVLEQPVQKLEMKKEITVPYNDNTVDNTSINKSNNNSQELFTLEEYRLLSKLLKEKKRIDDQKELETLQKLYNTLD